MSEAAAMQTESVRANHYPPVLSLQPKSGESENVS